MRKSKFFAGILIFIVGMAFTGCGSSSQSSSGSSTALKTIKDRGYINVGVKLDVPKFGYKDPKTSKIEGFEIDLSKAVAKKIFGDENKIKFQGVTAKTRGPLLDSGQVDMIAATFTVTDQRKKSYNFSDPYFTDHVGLMVKKSSGIKDLKGLNNKKIGVAQSATSKDAIQKEAEKVGSKVSFLEFGGYPDIKSALDSGRVDCFSVDKSILSGYLDDSTVLLKEQFSPQNYGIASKKGSDDLAKTINETISEMKKSGELNKLITKWGIQ